LPRYWALSSGTFSAVFMSFFLTWSGVSDGLSCSSRATSPLTTAAAWEVPEALANRVPTRASGCRESAKPSGTRRPGTDTPGATTSVSMSATPTPSPVNPAAYEAWAPTTSAML
jgi:hypothetical protein